MDGLAMSGYRAAQRLPVHREGSQGFVGLRFGQDVDDPALHGFFQQLRRQGQEQVAKRISRWRTASEAKQMPEFWILQTNPLGDGSVSSAAAKSGTNYGGQHGRKSKASSLSPAGIWDLLQICQQIPCGNSIQSETSVRKTIKPPSDPNA